MGYFNVPVFPLLLWVKIGIKHFPITLRELQVFFQLYFPQEGGRPPGRGLCDTGGFSCTSWRSAPELEAVAQRLVRRVLCTACRGWKLFSVGLLLVSEWRQKCCFLFLGMGWGYLHWAVTRDQNTAKIFYSKVFVTVCILCAHWNHWKKCHWILDIFKKTFVYLFSKFSPHFYYVDLVCL